ncbi:MAG: potassium channel family protein [Acutalibacteraceae bacterium]
MAKSFLIIGAGNFGLPLAFKLTQLGNDVVIIDKDAKLIDSIKEDFDNLYVGDCCIEDVISSLDVSSFDVCFVCVAEDYHSSFEITSMLKEFGAKFVCSTAKSNRQADMLKKIGADDVIYANRIIAEKTGVKYNAKNIIDLIQVTPEYAIYELAIPKNWVDKTIIELDVRNKYKVNIIAVKNGDNVAAAPGAQYKFAVNDSMIVIGEQEAVFKLANKS